jgi:hypothetical protein
MAVDHDGLMQALRDLGLLYGAKQPFADAVAGTQDETEAIRAYIERERPHLLKSYDLPTLVALVREARKDVPPGIEQYSPR